MKASKEVIEWLKAAKGIEFDAEADNGFGWYWTAPGDVTDDKGFVTLEEAAAAACEHFGITHFCIRGEPEVWGVQIICGGPLETCLNYLQSRKFGAADLMYPTGRLASYVY